MRRTVLFFLIQFFFFSFLSAQTSTDHWEALVKAENTWKYFLGSNEPPADWTDINFDDAAWLAGPGGIGYGDGDDLTETTVIGSVYLRMKFTINDVSEIEQAIFLADFDDAYVAYINGTEFSRIGISGYPPAYNQFADIENEASRYRGLYPSEIFLSKESVAARLQTGENILCVQVHNINETSSDLSSNFYLTAAMNVSDMQYQIVPSWFREPVDYENSNLPLVKINTLGNAIVDEPKVEALMEIIDNGPGIINNINDPANDYDGPIAIEIRGSSSQMFPKKQFGFELRTATGQDTSVALMGMPAEEDWILSAPYSDKSLIRNVLTFKLGADQGWYAPRTRLCEVYINNLYQGVYVLTEKIKRDVNRVDVSKLRPDENEGDDLTGGYIVKIDKFDGAAEGLGWDSPYPPPNKSRFDQVIHFQFHYPKEDEITLQQSSYIQEAVTDFEQALIGPNYTNLRDGYRQYIDVQSFIDFSIVNELTRNVDGYRLSTFMYKDKDSKDDKIYIGPLWDFNLAFGNADYCDGGMTSGWAWDFNTICREDFWLIPFWWQRLLRDPQYVTEYKERWNELRSGLYSNGTIMNYIDSVVTVLEDPQQRNFTKWQILDEWIWPNNYVGGSYPNEINYLKNWITDRLAWLDTNIAGLQVITGTEDILASDKLINVFPNPNNGSFHVFFNSIPSSDAELSLRDQLGRTVYREKILSGTESDRLVITNLISKGIYFMRITDRGELIHSEKIVIN